jgi:uncharacterized protein (UPF0212 family)
MYHCPDCGAFFDLAHVVSEEEILANEHGLSSDDIQTALESVGESSCPECFYPDIITMD